MNPEEIFTQFVASINHHDAEALASMMTPNHLFIDSLGHRVESAVSMQAGWRGYFAMCPDYWIRIDTTMSKDNLVLAAGQAGGTIKGTAWQTPAAWKAAIHADQVAEWQVFADNKPVYDILARQ